MTTFMNTAHMSLSYYTVFTMYGSNIICTKKKPITKPIQRFISKVIKYIL